MAEPLYELLVPYFDPETPSPSPPTADSVTAKYLARLTTLSLDALTSTESQSLAQSSHSVLVSLQALSNRSNKAFVMAADSLSSLQKSIPHIATETQRLRNAIPALDNAAVRFSSTYSKTIENPVLERRKNSMLLLRNVDRASDILELPTLLSTAVSSASATTGTKTTAATTNYSSALDLYAHIKRLQTLYPNSPLIKGVMHQADDAMKEMTTNLIAALRVQNLRLAAAMRTVGWLRRVAPELERSPVKPGVGAASNEGAYGALFLVCRLANLVSMLEALDPLRELADQETRKRRRDGSQSNTPSSSGAWAGQQTERFLKRYIEIYREQSFAIVSLYRNIFAPSSDSGTASADIGLSQLLLQQKTQPSDMEEQSKDLLLHLPPALATFPLYLVRLLTDTLKEYLPNVEDKSSRESLLTQVLYCASSLGRLGGNFSMILALLDEDDDDGADDETLNMVAEWEEVMKKHRVLSDKLDQLTAGGEKGRRER